MNIRLLCYFTIVLFSGQCFCYKLRITAIRPRGFRACIAPEKGLESFKFHAYTRSSKKLSTVLDGTVTKPSDGLWCFKENDIVLHFGDEIEYTSKVIQFGQTLSDTGMKILQAADFVVESGESESTSTVPSHTVETTTEAVGIFKRFKNWLFRPRTQEEPDESDFKNKKELSPPIYPVRSPGQGLPHNADERLTSIRTPITTEKATKPGFLHSYSQKEFDHGAQSTLELETQLNIKFESQENGKTKEMQPKSPQTYTVNEYERRSGSKLNEHKEVGGDQNNSTIENIEIQNYSLGVPATHANKSHNAGGTDLAHDDYIIPQLPATKVNLTSIEQQAPSEIFKISPKPHTKDNANARSVHTSDVKFEHQTHSETEDHHKSIEPLYVANVHIGKKEKDEENEDRNVSPPKKDAPLELKEDRIPTKWFGEYDYTVKGDIIKINVVINTSCTSIACNTSALFDLPNVDNKSSVLTPDEGITSPQKAKSCEALLFHEKKLSEAVRSNYQDCVIKKNVIENDLIYSKKEAQILTALLKETLAMINYLKVNSTNKLVLKSSIPLIDYKQVLSEVIHGLLNVEASKYNIVQYELESDNIVKFELGAYSEKLLLFLNGRIQLQGSNFQLIDYDAL